MAERVHRDDVRKFGVGVVALILAGAVAWIGATVQLGGELPAKKYTYVAAEFSNVGVLKPNQPVSEHGVHVGRVSDIEYRQGQAVVTLRLDGERHVYRNAEASIHSRSPLGRREVQIDPGTPDAGPLGNRPIPREQTRSSVAIDDVFSTFDKPTRAALRSSLFELGGGLAGHGRDVHDYLQVAPEANGDFGTVAATLADQRADVPELLAATSTLAGRFHGMEQELESLVDTTGTTFEAVGVDDGRPLRETLRMLPAILHDTKRGLDSMNTPLDDVGSAMRTLQPGARALGRSTGDLRGFLRDAGEPLDRVRSVSQQAVPAVDELTRTVTEASPTLERLPRTLVASNILLAGLAPYAPDIGRHVASHALLNGRIAPGQHYFSAMLVKGGLYQTSLPDSTVSRVPYPEPGGGAWADNVGGGR